MLKITVSRSYKLLLAGVIAVGACAAILGGYHLLKPRDNAKAYLTGFDRGNIINDYVMTNKNTMSEADINNFLHSKNSCNDRDLAKSNPYKHLGYTIRDGHFVCMADENFNGESAAHIIWQAAQDYSINPQVLIVLLQKEQGLVTDTWPNHNQYSKATGFACPDTGAGCDPLNGGFNNQIRKAAELFRYIMNRPNGSAYYPVGTRFVYYSPDKSCGGINVNIQNKATSALYQYTPYTPTDAVLNAGWGSVSKCYAYGNRNFYNYFTEWFGSTQGFEVKGALRESWLAMGGANGKMGYPIANEHGGLRNGGWYQQFQNGFIIGSPATGYWESKGSIRIAWERMNFENGKMGYPIGHELATNRNNSYYQEYEHGTIIGSNQTRYVGVLGSLRQRWIATGRENGLMGYPIADEVSGLRNGGWYQNFENGSIIGSPATGYWESIGKTRIVWASLGFEGGKMGYPTGPVQATPKYSGAYQTYENGFIIGSDKTGYWELRTSIQKYWSANGHEDGKIGYPIGHEVIDSNGRHQEFEHGTIYEQDGRVWFVAR